MCEAKISMWSGTVIWVVSISFRSSNIYLAFKANVSLSLKGELSCLPLTGSINTILFANRFEHFII